MTTDPLPYQDELREINAYSDRMQQDVRNQAPPIPARCHDFLDVDGQREARLVVLLDSRGRAIFIMRACMDSVDFRFDGTGTTCLLVKRRPAAG